jgi:hypothetical protein
MPERRRHWRETAESQEQVLARWQALSGGMSRHAWDWALTHRGWTPLGGGVAMTHSGKPSDRQLPFAAVLHAGKGASLSGDAGLVELGVTRIRVKTYDVVVPRDRHVQGVNHTLLKTKIHRTNVPETSIRRIRGLPLVKAELSVLHAAAWAKTDREAEQRLAMTVQQQITAVPPMRAALALAPRMQRRALIATVLDDIELGAHAQSEIEFLRFCRLHGVPVPDELQVKVRTTGLRYLDGRYHQQRVSLEIDGAHHRWAEQWDADTLRSLELTVAARGTGEQFIRLTQANLRHDAEKVVGLLKALLN